ncbi:hypothetical protein CIB95_00720 [Lottiidibacillus patelloidae]|uniref:DUF192 domain-containing protein n=1 Tax=Lottiidibacillus patelloidae TaxID=2670334 RepID=A0A263BWP4_9BACI|nr:DUF192 domain-containing protein [Lottiidibacillus patelloidae]OZM58135.1 hypothetical protein CIB95_00720 [Lottiidibacillus patelloidae]
MMLVNLSNGTILANKLKTAYRFFQRLKGLMFTSELPLGEALHLQPCQSVHTFFMKYDIDVIYLDKDMKIVKITHMMKPSKVGSIVKNANSVIELPAGSISKTDTKVGHVLQIKNNG